MDAQTLAAGYPAYVVSKVGEGKAAGARPFAKYAFLDRACAAAQRLKGEYDVYVALGRSGFWLGYVFEQYGVRVMCVRMGRRLNGAIWEPIDEVSKRTIEGKRVLVLEHNVVRGRTLRRALRELKALGPQSIDLLLGLAKREVPAAEFARLRGFFRKCPSESKGGAVVVDTSPNIPSGFRRVMTLEKDFAHTAIPPRHVQMRLTG